LRHFATYAAAPAGYTDAIIAGDKLGATGGATFPKELSLRAAEHNSF
jgi:hypothetical protein